MSVDSSTFSSSSPWTEANKLEFDMCIDSICMSDEAQSLFASGKKSEADIRASLKRLSSSGASVYDACETAHRAFARFVLKPPATPSAPAAAPREVEDRRSATDSSSAAPSAKRPRIDGAQGDVYNPADKGADLMRRHEHYVSAAVDKALYGKCTAEGQVFTPIAAITASADDLRATLDDVIARLGDCHAACKDLQQLYAHAMRCYWLANHTDGANWETVRQIHFRDRHDQEQTKFSVGPVQEMSWDEKVALAMKRIDQNRGLSKDGVLLGPICPDIPRGGRVGQRPLAEHNGRGRGGGYTGGKGGRQGGQANRGRQNHPRDGRGRDDRDGRNRRDDRDRRDNGRKDQGRGGDRSRTDAGSERP